jgi:hypothetical protein
MNQYRPYLSFTATWNFIRVYRNHIKAFLPFLVLKRLCFSNIKQIVLNMLVKNDSQLIFTNIELIFVSNQIRFLGKFPYLPTEEYTLSFFGYMKKNVTKKNSQW